MATKRARISCCGVPTLCCGGRDDRLWGYLHFSGGNAKSRCVVATKTALQAFVAVEPPTLSALTKLDRSGSACYCDAQSSPESQVNFWRRVSLSLCQLEVGMKRIGISVLAGLLVCALAGATVWAQATTAQISGTVKDQTGAVLPGVEIAVTQTATGAKRTAVSNETGSYVLASLPLGPYMLEAALPGFKAYVQTGIVLQVAASPTINVVLQVGQVADQVEVKANAALVETHSTGLGTVVD